MRIAVVRAMALYGPWDDFDPPTSRVVPALIRKAVHNEDPYEVWGSGEEFRDFLHINGLARACLAALEKYATCDPLNIGYGKAVTIKEITRIVLKAAAHEDAKVQFDTSKPSAVPIMMVDISKAKRVMGFEAQISLEEGLKDTVNWYATMRVA
jgi:GDP-L-fucose synthase